jgi:hypothetical protein
MPNDHFSHSHLHIPVTVSSGSHVLPGDARNVPAWTRRHARSTVYAHAYQTLCHFQSDMKNVVFTGYFLCTGKRRRTARTFLSHSAGTVRFCMNLLWPLWKIQNGEWSMKNKNRECMQPCIKQPPVNRVLAAGSSVDGFRRSSQEGRAAAFRFLRFRPSPESAG